jgi:hypothetical protein
MSAGLFDYSVAGPAAWFDRDVFTSNDPGAAAGWFDFDYLHPPFESTPQEWAFLLTLGGARWADDYFYLFDQYKDLAWELGFDDYSTRGVTFEQFERKITMRQSAEEKRDEFRQITTVFGQEAQVRAKMIKTAVTIAGVTYVVWRVLMWL